MTDLFTFFLLVGCSLVVDQSNFKLTIILRVTSVARPGTRKHCPALPYLALVSKYKAADAERTDLML